MISMIGNPELYKIKDRMIGQGVIITHEKLSQEELNKISSLLDEISMILHKCTKEELE